MKRLMLVLWTRFDSEFFFFLFSFFSFYNIRGKCAATSIRNKARGVVGCPVTSGGAKRESCRVACGGALVAGKKKKGRRGKKRGGRKKKGGFLIT